MPALTADPSFAPPAGYRADGGVHAIYGSNLLLAVSGDARWRPACHLWSLSIEEQFYLVWPFLVAALSPRAPRAPLHRPHRAAFAVRLAFTLGARAALDGVRSHARAAGTASRSARSSPCGAPPAPAPLLRPATRTAIALGWSASSRSSPPTPACSKDGHAFADLGYSAVAILFAGRSGRGARRVASTAPHLAPAARHRPR
jgi:peptidoglycan/LPS O-acetylase OafA/YrhL